MPPLADHPRWYAGGNNAVGHRPGDHGTSSNNRIAADVSQYYRVAANPRACTDRNQAPHSRLIANRCIGIAAMSVRAAWDMDAGGDQYIRLQMNEP